MGVTLLTAMSVGLATRSVPTSGSPLSGFLAGALAAVLAVVALRSVPLRVVVPAVCLLGAAVIVRFGQLDATEVASSPRLLLWVVSTAGAIVSATIVARQSMPEMLHSTSEVSPHGPPIRAFALVAAACVLGALLLGPTAAARFTGSALGSSPDFTQNNRQNSLAASDSLDMTNRPRLSDRIVMTVQASRGSFWRSDIFERWDGTTWRRGSDAMAFLPDGRVRPDQFDLAAVAGDELTQVVTIQQGFASAVPAAPSAVSITSAEPIVQRPDGTLVSALNPLGKGATYKVVSRAPAVSETILESIDGTSTPTEVLTRFASPPVATERTAELARKIDAGAATPYDKVRAVERWLSENTTYSLDAPLSPRGADVVDNFLFESRVGWCEQVASSMVVLLRLQGVPARLATGFVPGDWDPIARRYDVRESDAHSWTEVWFAGVGWVGFDPTADVPLAPDTPTTSGVLGWLVDHLVALLAALVVVLVLWVPATALVGRSVAAARGRRGRRRRAETWAATTTRELDRIGERIGVERRPSETSSRYADRLGGCFAEPDAANQVRSAGASIDRDIYSPSPLSDVEREAVSSSLASVGADHR